MNGVINTIVIIPKRTIYIAFWISFVKGKIFKERLIFIANNRDQAEARKKEFIEQRHWITFED